MIPRVLLWTRSGQGASREAPGKRNKEDSMRTSRALLWAVAVFGFGWSAGHVFSQDQGGDKRGEEPAPGKSSSEELKAWMDSMTPGEPHKSFAAQAGEYAVKGKIWGDPKGPPIETNATATIKMVMGGRYQVQEYKGDFMGMPYEGMRIAGYDNVSKEYFTVWMDNMRTGILVARGKADEKGVITLRGEMDDPKNPGAKCKLRDVMKTTDKDDFSFETWMSDSKHPEEFKVGEIDYTRRK
jgi:hypothetical protein